MKGFNLASVGGTSPSVGLTGSVASLAGSSAVPMLTNSCPRTSIQTLNENACGSPSNPTVRSPVTKLAHLARLAGARKVDPKKKWGNLIDAARSAKAVGRIWARSRSRSEDSVASECGASQIQAAEETTSTSNAWTRARNRSFHPHGVVHVTENELPEVLEESNIEWELSGRMGMDSTNSFHSSSLLDTSARHVRRARSEPVAKDTPASNFPDDSNQCQPYTDGPLLIPVTASATHLSPVIHFGESQHGCSIASPEPSPSRQRFKSQWSAPDCRIPFMDEGSVPDSREAGHKTFNGAPTAVRATTPTSSSDTGAAMQSSGRNLSGWL